MLLLILAVWQFWRYQKLSVLIAFKTNIANIVSVNTFLIREKSLECLQPDFTYSVYLFLKLRKALLIGPAENCPISRPVWLRNWWIFFGISLARHDIWREFRSGGHCSLWVIGRLCGGVVEWHTQCEQSPMHLCESSAPSGGSRLQSSMKFRSRN